MQGDMTAWVVHEINKISFNSYDNDLWLDNNEALVVNCLCLEKIGCSFHYISTKNKRSVIITIFMFGDFSPNYLLHYSIHLFVKKQVLSIMYHVARWCKNDKGVLDDFGTSRALYNKMGPNMGCFVTPQKTRQLSVWNIFDSDIYQMIRHWSGDFLTSEYSGDNSDSFQWWPWENPDNLELQSWHLGHKFWFWFCLQNTGTKIF